MKYLKIIGVICFFTYILNSCCAYSAVTVKKGRLESCFRYSDLFITGEVTSVNTMKVESSKYNNVSYITEVNVKIDNIIKGDYSDSHVLFIIDGGEIDGRGYYISSSTMRNIEIGDYVIAGLSKIDYGHSSYKLIFRNMFLKKFGNTYEPYVIECDFQVVNPLRILFGAKKKASIKTLFDESTIICKGVITGSRKSKQIGDSKIFVNVKEVLKGDEIFETITVCNNKRMHPYYVIDSNGTEVFLFLNKVGDEYHTTYGTFGIFRIYNDDMHNPFTKNTNKKYTNIREAIKAFKKE